MDETETGRTEKQAIDEIQDYIDTRYVSPAEAAWRLLEIPMHGRSHAVIRLPVHLPGQQYATFEEGKEVVAASHDRKWKTHLTAWFELNKIDETARNLTYPETPEHFTYNETTKSWKRRKIACKVVSRITSVSPRDSERFHLKLILGHTKNSNCFEDLRTINNVVYDTFRDTAIAMQLTESNDEAYKVFDEAVSILMPDRLRHFFVWYLIGEMPSNAIDIWNKYKKDLGEDFDNMPENRALWKIEQLLRAEGRTCEEFGIPIPEIMFEEDCYSENMEDNATFEKKGEEFTEKFNEDQQIVFGKIMDAITTENYRNSKCFFIDGPGGTGKTFIYNGLYYILRSIGRTVACLAWTGIAAILLPGGTTAHKTFNLPLILPEEGTIFTNPCMKKKLAAIDVFIWDECSMIPKRALEIIDKTLQDIMRCTSPFGGKTVILGGDFRQVLPIVKRGGKKQIMEETIKYSMLWEIFVKLRLYQNMRATEDALLFTRWLLDIGNGKIQFHTPDEKMKSKDIVGDLYPNEINSEELTNRAILAPKNVEVNQLNTEILHRMEGDLLESRSIDRATLQGIDTADAALEEEATLKYPIEYLNSLTPSGLPPHKLLLKVGAIVMSLRNLSISDGICNGTRLVVRALHSRILIAELLTGEKKGQIVELPRIKLDTRNDPDMPFVLHRRQFPVRLAFAMTINKAQGQSFDFVGLYIDRPIFAHGQLYVALSRCRSRRGLKIQTTNNEAIRNIVYKEIIAQEE